MMDNSLKLSFDFKSTNEAALIVYKTMSSYFMGDPTITIIHIFTGQEAIEIYSRITGKSIEDITKEAQNG